MKWFGIGLSVLLCLYIALHTALSPALPTGEIPANLKLPQSRKFLLSFSYQPPVWSEKAFAETFDFIGQKSDMIAHFGDDGIPWEEALRKKPYPESFEKDIQRRIKNKKPKQKILLTCNPVNTDRVSPALNWGEKGQEPLPKRWAAKKWGDEELTQAFINHCLELISRFQPDYFCYAFEVNAEFHLQSKAKQAAFVSFLKEVYSAIKAKHSTLPLFVEVVLGNDAYMKERWKITKAVLRYSDLIGVSTYPYVYDTVANDGSKMPKNWFERLRENVPGKAIAVSETGFLGGDFLHPKGTWIPGRGRVMVLGSEKSQASYLQFLLQEAHRLDFEFINWWAWRDLDALWEQIKTHKSFENPMWGMWNRTGLQDAQGRARSGQRIWEAWLKLPKQLNVTKRER